MAASASADDQFAVVDAMESDVAVKGGGFWFGSAGFWGEETYRGFVDSYKPNNLINVRSTWARPFDPTILSLSVAKLEAGMMPEMPPVPAALWFPRWRGRRA